METIARRRFAALTLGSAAGLLTGCSLLQIAGPPPQLYTLSPKSTFDPDLPRVTWQLLVQTPSAPAGLNSVRIALRETPFTLNYYADVAWTDRAPQMVQTLLLESFENSGDIISVDRQAIGLRANYILLPEMREFQAEYLDPGPPKANVSMAVRLVRMPDQVIIAAANFAYVATAQDERFVSIMRALDEALGTVMRDIVEWTLREGEADWRTQPRETSAHTGPGDAERSGMGPGTRRRA